MKGNEWAWPNVPQKLGPYALVDELGHGGMGIVFRARHVKLQNDCAVKVLIAGEHASPVAIARFQREAAAVAKMGKHPNIVTVHDLGQEGSLSYYAMELVEGVSLRRKIREESYKPKEAAALVEKLARALHFAHEHGVIHRDMKPDNVVVRADGEPQVMDFGLARDLGSEAQLSATGQVMGTPAYMAPEQARGEASKTDGRTDVYALGAILYELLTGIPPHGGRDIGAILSKILRGDIVPPRKLRPEVARDLETVCLKCMELAPAKRYQTAEELADDLARFQRSEPVHARPVGRVERFARRVRRHPLLSGLLAAVAVISAALLWRVVGPAELHVRTDPPNANVEAIDRTLWGGRWVWPAGRVRLLVSAEGYDTQPIEVKVSAGVENETPVVRLERSTGTITVDSDPPGAEAWLGDRRVAGVTPLVGVSCLKGDHVLTFRLKDYEDHVRRIVVRAAMLTDVGKVSLTHKVGTLVLTGSPVGMTVLLQSLDGEGADASASQPVSLAYNEQSGKMERKSRETRQSPPVSMPLSTGRYRLRGGAKDHFSRTMEVDIVEGQETPVFLSLTKQLLWSARVEETPYTPPAFADFDMDGVLDCAVADRDFGLLALSGRNGEPLWRFAARRISRTPSLGDLDLDGVPDGLAGSLDGSVYAVSGRYGSVLWVRRIGGVISTESPLADFDGDGHLDVLVASIVDRMSSAPGDRGTDALHALSGKDGRVLWTQAGVGEVQGTLSLGDVDGDGRLDCVVASKGGKVHALETTRGDVIWTHNTGSAHLPAVCLTNSKPDGASDCIAAVKDQGVSALSGRDGSPLWKYALKGDLVLCPGLGDLNDDGTPDCVVGTKDDRVHALSGDGGAVLWSTEIAGSGGRASALGDLDGDGVLDCVVAGARGSLTVLSGKTGRAMQMWETGALMCSSVGLADLNGDYVLDIVAGLYGDQETRGAEENRICALSGRDIQVVWAREAGDAAVWTPSLGDLNGDRVLDCIVGSDDHNVYALEGSSGSLLWRFQTGGKVESVPAVGDLNRDGVPDCIVGSEDGTVYALSGRDGAPLWRHRGAGPVWSSPALEDLNGDGVLDCVIGSDDKRIYALSGMDGSELWGCDVGGEVASTAGFGDFDGDGRPECVVHSLEGKLYALSGQDGSVLWTFEAGTVPLVSPAIGDMDGDGLADCVVASQEGFIHALRGKDGRELWYWCPNEAMPIFTTPTLGDLDGDRVPDCIVHDGVSARLFALSGARQGALLWSRELVSDALGLSLADVNRDGCPDCLVAGVCSIRALSGIDGSELWTYATDWGAVSPPIVRDIDGDGVPECLAGTFGGTIHVLRPALLGRSCPTNAASVLGGLRGACHWKRLEREAEARSTQDADRGGQAIALMHLGLAQLRLDDPRGALVSFAKSRALGLRAPDGAVFEWLASWRWADCPQERRKDARSALQASLRAHPIAVFDTYAEVVDLFTEGADADLRTLLDGVDLEGHGKIVRAVLLAMRGAGTPDILRDAEKSILSELQTADGNPSRWVGFLALLSFAAGDNDRFARHYRTYLDLSGRPRSLDRALSELSSTVEVRDLANPAYKLQEQMDTAIASEDYQQVRQICETILASELARTKPVPPLIKVCHYNLACCYSQLSVGKDGPKAEAKPVSDEEATRCRERAFQHLRRAIDLGYGDGAHLREDADLRPLHDDPRWKELLDRLGR